MEDAFDPNIFALVDYQWVDVTVPSTAPVRLLQSRGACTDWDLTGQILWPASRVLAHYVAEILGAPGHLARARVLELGAGTGLVGLVASRWATHVELTDGSDEICALLRRTVAGHREWADAVDERRLVVRDLQWAETAQIDGMVQWLFGADVVQWPDALAPMIRLVARVLAEPGVNFFVCGYVNRSEVLRQSMLSLIHDNNLQVRQANWQNPDDVAVLVMYHNSQGCSAEWQRRLRLVRPP